MKQFITTSLVLITAFGLQAQEKYFTRDGNITFFSETPIENIEAVNQKATCVLDAENGKVEFAVLIKSFEFEKALMEEHFNENYMESTTFPKATFKGMIVDFEALKAGGYSAESITAQGKLNIHGVEQDITATGKLNEKGENMHLIASFEVKPEDHDIDIPNTVREKIAKQIMVNVDAVLKPLNR